MTSIKSWAVSVALMSALLLPVATRAADDVAYEAIKNHDWISAEQQLQAGLQKEPGNVSRQLNLAWVYAQTGRKTEAAALYREILRHEQDRVASLSSSGGTSISLLAERGLALLARN